MAVVTGFVERIKYRNEDNGYTVLSLNVNGEETAAVGTFHYISEGELVEASGQMTVHPVYGEQLTVESYEIKTPEDTLSMERYLGSGAIKGIGAALASRIVRRFKKDTFRIMEEEPERLSEIKGISEKMAMAIAEQVQEKKEMRQAMMFLQEYGISMNLAVKIYQQYGPKLYSVLRENPYQLADDIPGVGFKAADEIAQKVGIFTDSDFRIRCGLLYTLLQAVGNGHTYLPREELLCQAAELLKTDLSLMEKHLMDMQIDKKIVVKTLQEGERQAVYAAQYYYLELNTARMLHDLNIRGEVPSSQIEKRLSKIQSQEEFPLDELQAEAVRQAVNCGLLIITGGPGTGKTTTINAIIRFFEQEGMEILLAAPTGRAAKRMAETTGCEARTIHRLLELSGGVAEEKGKTSGGMRFERNEENPLDGDVVIIDEMSMVDIFLMQALLKAVIPGTRLILVGDVNQLPSVGPGRVLKDIIASEQVPVTRLTEIFRQAKESDIIVNAHRINRGEPVTLDNKSMDFFFLKRYDADQIINVTLQLVLQKLPKFVDAQPMGVERLNQVLQQYLNPPDASKSEKERASGVFREGDKVMQTKNNYQLEWEVRSRYGIPVDKGLGVFNGDIGIIRIIDSFAHSLTVEFEEGRMVEYPFGIIDELELAYAVTIHKSQGSEYPAVVLPLMNGPRPLMNRNLLYTAVTRARKCVTIVGDDRVFTQMVDNVQEQQRFCGLERAVRRIFEDH